MNSELSDYIKSQLPSEISSLISNTQWEQKTEGQSGDSCFLVSLKDGNRAYLKSYFGSKRPDYENEMKIVNWLNGKIPVSKILANGKNDRFHFILWNELQGKAGHDLAGNHSSELIIKLCAETLKEIHLLPVQDCPIYKNLKIKIPEAFSNADQGLVRLNDLDEARKGWPLEQLKQEVLNNTPVSEDLVFTHGDFCLPNIIFNNNHLSGLIDLGRAGIADRHQDIALILSSLSCNLNRQCDDLFLQHYGLIKKLDQSKIEFYRLLDEFF